MKPAQSHLIDMFLADVKSGLIVGREDSTGTVTLQEMADALQSILDGKKTPQQALKIKRKQGKPTKDDSILMAFVIHQLKKAGDSWAIIEVKIKEQFPQVKLPDDAITNLKKLHTRNKTWLTRQDAIDLLKKELNKP